MKRNNVIHHNVEQDAVPSTSSPPSSSNHHSKLYFWVMMAICSLVSMEMFFGLGSRTITHQDLQQRDQSSRFRRGLRQVRDDAALQQEQQKPNMDDFRDRYNDVDARRQFIHRRVQQRQQLLQQQRLEGAASHPRHGTENMQVEQRKRMLDKERASEIIPWPDPNILRNVAVDNTIIMISANCGYVNMAQNWIIHVKKLNITNFIVIAQDENVYDVLSTFVPGHVVMLDRDHPSNVQVESDAFSFASQGFYEICKQRPHMIQSILDQGYKVLYSDTDLVWLKNPFEQLPDNVDYVGMTDVDNEDPEIDRRDVCSAFLYFQPNYNTKMLLSYWTKRMVLDQNQYGHDQDHWRETLQKLKGSYTMHLLPKQLFPPGFLYFDVNTLQERLTEIIPSEVYTVHANWMTGYRTKVSHLKDKGHWLIKKGNELICRA